jgi:hypothetical protein
MADGLYSGVCRAFFEDRKMCLWPVVATTVALGDVIEFQSGVPSRVRSLRDVLPDHDPGDGRSEQQPQYYVQASAGVEREFAAEVGAPTAGGAVRLATKATVTMKGEYRFSLSMSEVDHRSFSVSDELSSAVRGLFWRNAWNTRWVIVTDVWRAASTTLLISGSTSREATFEFDATADIGIDDANLAAGFSLRRKSEGADSLVGHRDFAPMFDGVRIGLWDVVTGGDLGPVRSVRLFGEDGPPDSVEARIEKLTTADLG